MKCEGRKEEEEVVLYFFLWLNGKILAIAQYIIKYDYSGNTHAKKKKQKREFTKNKSSISLIIDSFYRTYSQFDKQWSEGGHEINALFSHSFFFVN